MQRVARTEQRRVGLPAGRRRDDDLVGGQRPGRRRPRVGASGPAAAALDRAGAAAADRARRRAVGRRPVRDRQRRDAGHRPGEPHERDVAHRRGPARVVGRLGRRELAVAAREDRPGPGERRAGAGRAAAEAQRQPGGIDSLHAVRRGQHEVRSDQRAAADDAAAREGGQPRGLGGVDRAALEDRRGRTRPGRQRTEDDDDTQDATRHAPKCADPAARTRPQASSAHERRRGRCRSALDVSGGPYAPRSRRVRRVLPQTQRGTHPGGR